MIGTLSGLTLNRDGTQNITVTVNTDFSVEYDALKDKEINVEIKKYSKRRSLDANAYLWYLCSEVAKRSSKFSDDGKEDVYREAIRAKGEFEPLLVRTDAVEKFQSRWSDKGAGWFADVMDDYKDRYKIVHAYYGSSTYDSLSMSRIIDYVIMKAEDLGISTITPKEKEKLLGKWAVRNEKKEDEI